MPWSITLCVYKFSAKSDVGHAFVCVESNGNVVVAAGLSPASLPEGILDELRTVFPKPGRIYSEWDSLLNANLRTRRWPIAEQSAVAVMNQINSDRRKGPAYEAIPDGDGFSADRLVAMAKDAMQNGAEWAGGPNYALLWSQCAIYALSLLELAGVDVSEYKSLVSNPATIYNRLPA